MTEKWKCVHATYVAGFGIVPPGKILEFAEGNAPLKVKALFEKVSDNVAEEERKKAEAQKDMTFRAKVERLKDMKVPIPKGANKEQIDELFRKHIETVEVG